MLQLISALSTKNLRLCTGYFIRVMSTAESVVFSRPKYNGRSKKRQWENRREDKGAGLNPAKKERSEDFVRVKRRKCALLLGYCGVDYYGMQRNPSTRTIEEDLFTALLKADLITQEAFEQVQSIQFQRAARTDKGVSAARQVVSIKLPDVVDLIKVNSFLPEVIRVFGLKRVTKGFNSKSNCCARTYTYMLPTIAFARYDEDVDQETYRIGTELLEKVNQVLQRFVGTKNHHNFTSKKKPNDPSAARYIMSFRCDAPFVRKNVEFAVLEVKGQSFMLHQIRKMVGLMLAVIRGHTSEEVFDRAWSNDRIDIPRAPGLGLVLDRLHYDRYNARYGDDGIHETLEWVELDAEVNTFKEKYIYPNIVDTEVKEKEMMYWLATLSRHDYAVREDDVKSNESNDSGEEESNDDLDIKRDITNDVKINDATDNLDVVKNNFENDIKKDESMDNLEVNIVKNDNVKNNSSLI